MNFVYFLDQRLKFVTYFYDSSVAPFLEIKRKIREGEEPYVDRRDPEDCDEPAFYQEWEDADVGVDVIGMTCLGMVQSAFHSFLKHFVSHFFGGKPALSAVNKAGDRNKGWFGRYWTFFEGSDFDWTKSGVDLEFLEKMILARNDSEHYRELFTPYTYQSPEHVRQFPDSEFRDTNWPAFLFMNKLAVSRDVLARAAEAVLRLCDFLDDVQVEQVRRRGTPRPNAT